MLLISKSDTGSDFANFLYRSSFPCRAHSASCRGCASVNKMENFARRPVHHILSIFSHQDKPQLSHFQFLDAAQTGTRAQRQPGDENKQVTDTDRDPRPETTRRREEQTRLVFQRQLWPLSVVDTKFSYKSIFGGTSRLPSGAYISFQTLVRHQQSQNRPRFWAGFKKTIFKSSFLWPKLPIQFNNVILQWKLHSGIHRLAPTE